MYKLVDKKWETRNNTQWSIGQTNKVTGEGKKLCSPDLLHCYKSPVQAILFNPIHASIRNPILLEIECSELLVDDGLKYGCKEQTPLKELSLPDITIEQKVAFAIYCALEVYSEKTFVVWANNWLSGKDRSCETAEALAASYWSAAAATATTAAAAAARVRVRAAEVRAVEVRAVEVAVVAAWAAAVKVRAARAAEAAAWVAAVKTKAGIKLDFDSLAKKAGIIYENV